MNDNVYGPAMWVIEAVRAALTGDGAAEVKARLSLQNLSPAAAVDPGACRLPATRYFAECVAATMFVAPDVAAALAEVEEFLHWKQNPNYSDAVMGEGYMDGYAYAEIIGPDGFFPGEDFLLGLFLLGPGRLYLDHHHPAPELYWLLTGPSDWRRDGGDFTRRASGETVWHPPLMHHATRTGASPLLAVWAWTRDVATPARLVDEVRK